MTTTYFVPQRTHPHLIGREAELREIMARLSALDDRVGVVTIEGVAGLGKSAIAQEVAWRYIEEHERLSPDARFDVIIWATARHVRSPRSETRAEPAFTTLDDVFRSIAAALEIPTLMQVSPEERPKQCWAALQLYQRVLLVIDNLEADADDSISRFLRDLPKGTQALVTTQFHENLPYPLRVRPLEPAVARELLASECSARGIALSHEQLDALTGATDGMPLAAHLLAGLCAQNGADAVMRSLADVQVSVSSTLLDHAVAHLKQHQPESYRCLLAFALFDPVGGATGSALAACLGLDAATAGRARAHLEYLNLVQPVQEPTAIVSVPPGPGDGLRQLDAALRERDTMVRYAVLPITHRYLQREVARQHDWEHQTRVRQRGFYQQVAVTLDDPARYTHTAPEAANLIAVMRWLSRAGETDQLAAFFGATQEFLYAQTRWDELLDFAGHIFDAMSRQQVAPTREILSALLQSPVDISRRRSQMQKTGTLWISDIQALSYTLRDRFLEAELDLARRRLLCNDGTLGTTMHTARTARIPPGEVGRYVKLEDPDFVDDIKTAIRVFADAGRADKVFQAHVTLGNFYRVSGSYYGYIQAQPDRMRADFDRALRRYELALTVLEGETRRSSAWREMCAAVVRASQAMIAGRSGRPDEACDALSAVRVALVDTVDRVEADIARAYYEYRRGNGDRAIALRTAAVAAKVKLGLRSVPLCLEDALWDKEASSNDPR